MAIQLICESEPGLTRNFCRGGLPLCEWDAAAGDATLLDKLVDPGLTLLHLAVVHVVAGTELVGTALEVAASSLDMLLAGDELLEGLVVAEGGAEEERAEEEESGLEEEHVCGCVSVFPCS
jgi:hypothetical protein